MPADQFLNPRPTVPSEFASTPGGQLVQSASLTLRLLKAAKVRTLDELIAQPRLIPANVRLEREQFDMIQANRGVLRQLRYRTDTEPLVTIAVCLTCARWHLAGGDATKSSSKKCSLTTSCPGPVVKATDAVGRQRVVVKATAQEKAALQ